MIFNMTILELATSQLYESIEFNIVDNCELKGNLEYYKHSNFWFFLKNLHSNIATWNKRKEIKETEKLCFKKRVATRIFLQNGNVTY